MQQKDSFCCEEFSSTTEECWRNAPWHSRFENWMKKLTFVVMLLAAPAVFSQIQYYEDFDPPPTGWLQSGNVSFSTVNPCEGYSARVNVWQFNTAYQLIAPPIIGQSNGNDITISFDYKIVDWSSPNPATGPNWGEFHIQYSTDGENWTTALTVDDSNHVASTACNSQVAFISNFPEGEDFHFRITGTHTSGDYLIYWDNLVILQTPSDAVVDWGNLQSPASGTIQQGDSFNVYGQVYVPGVTEGEGQGENILAWVGWSATDSNPAGWSTWTPATFNTTVGNNDEYMFDLGAAIPATGNYYYAFRYQHDGGAFYYGGYNATGGGAWDGTNNVSGVLSVNVAPEAIISCPGEPQNFNYCYTNNENREWLYESSDGGPISMVFYAGTIESFTFDKLHIYDGTNSSGTLLYSNPASTTQLDGLTLIANSGSIYMTLTTDGSVSCSGTAAYVEWDFDISCGTDVCLVPEVSHTIGDCDNNQYNIQFNVTDMGNSDVLTFTNGSEVYTATAVGTFLAGPYESGSTQTFTLNSSNPQCSDRTIEVSYTCPPPGSTCEDPYWVTSLPFTTTDNTANYGDDYSGGQGSNCGSTSQFYLNGDDVVYAYTATETGSIRITMDPTATYSGLFVYDSCENIGVACLAGVANSTTNVREIEELPVVEGQTYYIVISTWAAPQSTGYDLEIRMNTCTQVEYTFEYDINCSGGEGDFNVDVNIANLGSADSIEITDGTNTQTITEPGTYTFGPYDSGANVDFDINTGDENCDTSFSATYTCPPTGSICEDPHIVTTLPYFTSDNTANYGDDYSGGQGSNCGSTSQFYLSGDDVVYAYTATETGSIRITMDPTASYSGLFVYDSCANIGVECLAGVANSTTEVREIEELPVVEGQTYYIVISTWASPQSTAYDLEIRMNTCTQPTYTVAYEGNCEDGEGTYNALVDVTSLGTAESIILSDGTNSWTITETGVVSTGPYASGSTVNFTMDTGDENCFQQFSATYHCPPVNDDCETAEMLMAGTTFEEYAVVGTTLNATHSGQAQSCGGTRFNDVWYTVTVPATGAINIETRGNGGITDSVIEAFSGSCDGELVSLGCNDDGGEGLFSLLQLTDLTPGSQIYVMVWRFGGSATNVQGTFEVSAWHPDAVPYCEAPTELSVTNITANSADISWTPNGSEWYFEVLYVESGQEPDETLAVLTVDTSFNYDGYMPGTSYDFYVRSVCELGSSEWTYVSFTTLEDEPVEPGDCDLSINDVEYQIVSPYRILFNVLGAESDQRYEMSAGVPGYTPVNSNFGMQNLQMPYLRTSLHAGRSYDFYIRPINPSGQVCDWVGPISITMPTVADWAARTPVLYPNPARDVVAIEGVQAQTVMVYSVSGAQIGQLNVSNGTIQVNHLPTGRYELHIVDAEGNITVERLIKK